MKVGNGILACLLGALTLLSNPASPVARAQLEQSAAAPAGKRGYPSLPPEEGHAFLITVTDGEIACRDATPVERLTILKRDPKVHTSPVRTAAGSFNSNTSLEGETGTKDWART